MTGDVIAKRGFGALSCRIRRLSERLDRDIRDVYQAHGVYFDPCWFPLVAALLDHGAQSLPEIAARTGLGATSLAQIKTRMLAEGLLSAQADPRDQRRQLLALTPKARNAVDALEAVWAALAKASEGLCAETVPQFLSNLEVIETALTRRRMSARVKTLMER